MEKLHLFLLLLVLMSLVLSGRTEDEMGDDAEGTVFALLQYLWGHT